MENDFIAHGQYFIPGMKVLMEEPGPFEEVIIPAIQAWSMDEKEDTGKCRKTPSAGEDATRLCPVFPVDNGALLVGLGLFMILLPIVPVIIGIPQVMPPFMGVLIGLFGAALVWKGMIQ